MAEERFLATCAAVMISITVVILLGGFLAVRYRNGVIDKTISGFACLHLMPEFFIGYLFILFFATSNCGSSQLDRFRQHVVRRAPASHRAPSSPDL